MRDLEEALQLDEVMSEEGSIASGSSSIILLDEIEACHRDDTCSETEPEDGPDGMPASIQEVHPQVVNDEPQWDPLRPFLPTLAWVEQYKPGLAQAIATVVTNLAHKDKTGCPLRNIYNLPTRQALPSEIQNLSPTVDSEVQTDISVSPDAPPLVWTPLAPVIPEWGLP